MTNLDPLRIQFLAQPAVFKLVLKSDGSVGGILIQNPARSR